MSTVDAPPGLEIGGLGPLEFGAPDRKQRLAKRVLAVVLATGIVTLLIAARRPHQAAGGLLFAAPLFLISVAILGVVVRSARISVEPDALRWGWRGLGFRARLRSIRWVHIYDDAIAMRSNRGSVWYLSAADLEGFPALCTAIGESQFPASRRERRAPLWARLQSYGRFLDFLLVMAAAGSVLALIIAVT